MNAPLGHRPLHILAEKFGIARAYHGVDGHHHQVPDDTLAAILLAIGIEAGSDSEAAGTWASISEANAERGLPPVIRVRQGEAPRLPRTGPAMAASWQMNLDDGTARSGIVSTDGETGVLDNCTNLPIGCHHLVLDNGDTPAQTTLIIAPQTAWQVSDMIRDDDLQNDRPRLWGITVPLYALRSVECLDGGIGTYADWGNLAANAHAWGADFAGVNPVHALFPADPARCSPYSPSSRLFLNVLHIAPHRVPGFEACPVARDLWNQCRDALGRLRQADLIDYSAVASHLFPVLQALYDHRPGKAPPDQATDTALARHALFEALHEHFCRQLAPPAPWQDWPEAFRRPDSAAVTEFSRTHADRVGFFAWLQQMADAQLADVAGCAKDAGAAIGLYADLAVGVARDGADVWAKPEYFAQDISLGAPPDGFAPGGQNWALAPFNPLAIRAAGFAPFRAMLRATMRHAGLVRIDHVLGFARSFWIPDGLPGTYIAQPLDELLDMVAIESRRARCAVIGEDLGNVPDGLRDTLANRGMLGTRVAWFEREEGGRFRAPAHYPQGVCAALSSHDLPTLRGYWQGTDIGWRQTLGQIAAEAANHERAARQNDKAALLDFADLDRNAGEATDPAPPTGLAASLYGQLAGTPSTLVSVQIEDMLGQSEQANLPGTIDSHPNWRRRLPVPVADMADDPGVQAIAAAMRRARPSRNLNTGKRPEITTGASSR